MYNFLKKIRSELLVYLTHKMALPVLRIIRKPEIFPYTVPELMEFPDHTLGKDLVKFLEIKQLGLLPYYARHDIKHILLDYNTTDEGEGCLQCFMLGNGHYSFPVIATVLYGFVTMPEHWTSFKKAYARGKHTTPIGNWNWFNMLTEKTLSIKDSIECHEKIPF